MSRFSISLDQVKVASPCPASWDAMTGDDRVRFCSQCSLHVYNLSDLSRDEAQALVAEKEGKMCVRYFQRADGTVITRDCPVGWAAVKRRLARIGKVAGVLFVVILGVSRACSSHVSYRSYVQSVSNHKPSRFRLIFTRLHDWWSPPPPPVVMGKMCPPAVPGPPVSAVPPVYGQPVVEEPEPVTE